MVGTVARAAERSGSSTSTRSAMKLNRHRSRVVQKMQVHWVAHLVRLAEKLGLTMP